MVSSRFVAAVVVVFAVSVLGSLGTDSHPTALAAAQQGIKLTTGAADSLLVAIDAEFDHPPQVGMFRTLLSSVTPISFTADQTGGMTARFLPEPADCFGMISWVADGNQSKAVGPAVMCMANSAVTEPQFNVGLTRGKDRGVDSRLVIPLGPPQPGEPIDADQIPSQTRRNTSQVISQVFLSGCDMKEFHKLGEVVFEKDKLAFTFWTDDQGKPQVKMSAAPVLLRKLNPDTWMGCDAAQVLPSSPPDGQSASFTGSSVQQPLDPSMLSGQVSLLLGQIDSLVYQRQLDLTAAQRLMNRLGGATKSLQRAHADQGLHEFQKFRDDLATLGNLGVIDPGAAASLAKVALGIETFLTEFVDLHLSPPNPDLYCSGNGAPCPDTVSSCQFTSWHVDGTSIDEATPDGSPKHPFASITEALTQAAKTKLCGVTLRVAPAHYTGPLEITRHTQIIGEPGPISATTFPTTIIEGSVSNHGPYVLEISDITLSWFHDEVANGVFVDHPCAKTVLQNVAVLGYRGFGIRQRGGSLLSQRTIVANTRAHPDSLLQGTGMLLSCGVRAVLLDVVLNSNESSGLLIAHPGTLVNALNLLVRGTRVHPSLPGAPGDPAFNYAGAVQVRHQARLNATGFSISENWLVGVLVDTGAVARLDYGTISDTVPAPVFPEWPYGLGGTNAVALRDGHLTMVDVLSTRAAQCGVMVAADGQLDLQTWRPVVVPPGHRREILSQVNRNVIGACVNVPGYRLSRLMRSTVYIDNITELVAGDDFPIPHPPSVDLP